MVRRTVILLLAFVVGGVVGFAFRGAIHKQQDAKGKNCYVEKREGEFNHINPLLDSDIADDVLRNTELIPFKDKISEWLNDRANREGLPHVSVYFRELNDGLWFSIGNTQKFVPASLHKIPMMIALLKMSESRKGSNLLDRKVTLDTPVDNNAKQNIKPSQTLVRGRKYTIRELIYHMIVFSDNNAFMALSNVVDYGQFDKVYSLLDIKDARTLTDDDFLTVQTYASFFRILYNATYLTKEDSDWALDLLAKSEFKTGLVAGVPSTVEVAHKFGEHSNEKEGTVQLHDCGIVYYPHHPYLLCVMSKGTTFGNLDDMIVAVSRMVYNEVAAQDKTHRE